MRHFVCMLCGCLVLLATTTAQIKSDLHNPLSREKIGLKGPVRTIKIEQQTITILDDRIIEDLKLPVEEATFDPQGRMIEFKDYPERGVLRRWSRYEYNQQRLQNSTSDFYDKEGKLYRKTQYLYDEAVGIKLQTNFDYDDKGGMFRKTVLTREPPDGAVDVKEYKPDGTIIKRNLVGNNFHFKLTQSGRIIKKDSSPAPPTEQPKTLPVKRRVSYDAIDAHGNWTTMSSPVEIRVSNGHRVEIKESFIRTITYY